MKNTANFLRRVFISLVSLVFIIPLATLTAGIVEAHGVIDQSFSTTPNSWSQACSGQGGWNGQTFTPTASDILGFDIYFDTAGGATAIGTVFSITSWPNTANILATAPASTSANGLVHFDLPSSLSITPGQKYAIMLTGGPNTCFRTSYYDPSYFYTRGGGVTWYGAEDGGLDIAFKTYATPVDTDGDTVFDHLDNCPAIPNSDQLNTDGDTSGNACDTDDDGDGIDDNIDVQPLVSTNETFSDIALGGKTSGVIQARGGYNVTISEYANPEGVAINVTGSGSHAQVKLDNKPGVEKYTAGSYILTDPDKTTTMQVISGQAEMVYVINGVTYTTTIYPSSTAQFIDHAGGDVTISALSGNVTVNGTTISVGTPYVIEGFTKYEWSGFLQPINADNSSIFKLGSTVPVRFQLTNGTASTLAKLYVAKIDNGIEGSVTEAASNVSADSGNTFRYDGAQYTFNLGTKNLTKGTYKLKVYVDGDNTTGGLQGEVDISLK
jgi:hypothetical protein